ncbi:MAG: lactate utilization protein [Myxococcales bacterium]|nr:lactate utilization protein [Myxococcales bacterium]
MKGKTLEHRARRQLSQSGLADTLYRATQRAVDKRNATIEDHAEWERRRDHARQIKLHTLCRIDELLAQFIERAQANGFVVHAALDAEEARRIALRICRDHGVTRVIKGKSMVSEEIALNPALEAAGIEVTESDLGELIVQLLGQAPAHITAPAIHLAVEEILTLFRERLAYELPSELRFEGAAIPPRQRSAIARDLTLAARRFLQRRFLRAQLGFSGANFLIADSGRLVLLENEANIRLSTTLPRVHVAIAGFDKLIPSHDDLATFLHLLPTSSTGQRLTSYVSEIGDGDGRHIILLDNGRSQLLADAEHYDLLSCIRCGACSNVCPIFRNIGGHGYGGVYSGPIGAALLPHLGGIDAYGDLPFASSLCGACSSICPVGIPIHERLLEWRERAQRARGTSGEKLIARAFAWLIERPAWFAAAATTYPLAQSFSRLLPVLRRWSSERDLPEMPRQTFLEWIADEGRETQRREEER